MIGWNLQKLKRLKFSQQNQIKIGQDYLDHFLGQVSHTPKPFTCKLWYFYCLANFFPKFHCCVISVPPEKFNSPEVQIPLKQFSAQRYKKVSGFLLSWSKKNWIKIFFSQKVINTRKDHLIFLRNGNKTFSVTDSIYSDRAAGTAPTIMDLSIGGSKGCARDASPPGGPKSFIFVQFSAKNLQNNTNLGVGTTPPSGKSWIRHWPVPSFHVSITSIEILYLLLTIANRQQVIWMCLNIFTESIQCFSPFILEMSQKTSWPELVGKVSFISIGSKVPANKLEI